MSYGLIGEMVDMQNNQYIKNNFLDSLRLSGLKLHSHSWQDYEIAKKLIPGHLVSESSQDAYIKWITEYLDL